MIFSDVKSAHDACLSFKSKQKDGRRTASRLCGIYVRFCSNANFLSKQVIFMFFFAPIYYLIIIYVLAAVLPAVFLMKYIYKQDAIEKEPPALLWNLALRGVLAALVSIVLEMLGESVLNSLVEPDNPIYIVILAFLVVAAVEEGTKFFFLYRRTWHDFNFNYRFDGIIYAVFVSLGFAAFENIKYVFSYGLSVALPRAVLSIPGHMGFAVIMGLFYGRAKLYANRGNRAGCGLNLILGYLAAVFLHGVYDTCCMSGTAQSTLVFVLFVLIMYLAVFRVIKHESRTDTPI
ncbi:MAG: PrsW family intramembrane metalloprotease [Oscillospiraceae bacterium]